MRAQTSQSKQKMQRDDQIYISRSLISGEAGMARARAGASQDQHKTPTRCRRRVLISTTWHYFLAGLLLAAFTSEGKNCQMTVKKKRDQPSMYIRVS